MGIKKNFSAPLATGLGAMRRAAMLLLMMLLTTASAWAAVGDVVDSGTCGDNLTWTLTENGEDDITLSSGTYAALTLTITGTGAMYDYTGDSDRPWNSTNKYRYRITKLVLPSGITRIGNHAFYFTNFSGPLTIPEGVETIGDYGFYAFYKATSVTLPASVTSIGENAFPGAGQDVTKCPFTAAEGSKLTSIGTNAFRGYKGNVDLRNCKSLTTIGENVFYNFKKTVYLPISLRTIEENAFYSTNVSTTPTVMVAYDNSVVYVNGTYKTHSTEANNVAITSHLNLRAKSSDAVSICQIFFDEINMSFDDDGHYFAIADEQDLIDLAEYIRGGTGRYCEGATFKMTADLDFTDMPLNCHDKKNYGTGNFVPIDIDFDNGGSVFKGHFDGDGHSITGLRFSYTSHNIGLFRVINNANASVENLTLVNPNFSAHYSVGGIVGILRAGTVSNCTVVGGTVSGSSEVGAIVGFCIYDTSTDVKTITGCTVIGTTVSGSSEVGAIVGTNTGSPPANNALTISNCTYDATTNENIVGDGYGTMFTDGGGNKMVYQVNLGENVTASGATYSSALLPGKAYYASGATVTLGHTDRTGYDFSNYSVNGTAIDGSTFTMPASNVTVSATWTPDPVHFADNGDGTYTIKTATGWDVFCDALQDNDTWNGFSGKTVKLGGDIGTAQDPITRMAGSDKHDFCGTFDGQGHTLNVNLNGAQYVAPFFYVKSQDNDHPATIQNLKVSGTVTGSDKFAAGIAGGCAGKVNITNCLVDVTINSSVNGDGTHGGLVGVFDGGTLNITDCAFTGKLLSIGSGATTKCGGFVGYSHVNGTAVNITNSLYAPAALVGSETEPTSNSMTFLRSTNTTVTITNSYYTRTLGDAQGSPVPVPTFAPEGYATFYSSVLDVVVPEGMKARIVTGSADGGKLTYQDVADGDAEVKTVPAGTAVMLQVEAGTTAGSLGYDIGTDDRDFTTAEGNDNGWVNLLHGSDVATTTTGGAKYYKLSYNDGYTNDNKVIGWYWGADGGTAFESGANKAWLALGETLAGARFFGLPEYGETTTAVFDLNNKEEIINNKWYDLQGRCVERSMFNVPRNATLSKREHSTLQKGVYIVNGKKIVIK